MQERLEGATPVNQDVALSSILRFTIGDDVESSQSKLAPKTPRIASPRDAALSCEWVAWYNHRRLLGPLG